MDNIKNDIGYFPQVPVCDKLIDVEINSDFTLPDYKSEIRRLLNTEIAIIPKNEYVGNGEALCEGELICKVLYLGADGGFYCTALSDKYSIRVPFDFNSHSVSTDEITLVCDYKCDNITTRVLGPRKLNLRSKLTCRALALAPSIYIPNALGSHNASTIESLVFEAPCVVHKACKSEVQLLSDIITLEENENSLRIIDVSCKPSIEECIAKDGETSVRGDVFLKLTYCDDTENATPRVTMRKIPFSLSIECDELMTGFECSAYGVCYDEQATLDESSIKVDFALVVFAIAQRNVTVKYVNDAFSTEKECECKSNRASVLCGKRAMNSSLSQNTSFSLDELGLPEHSTVIDVITNTKIENVNYEKGKILIQGSNIHKIICFTGEEYTTKELNSALKCEFDARSPHQEASIVRSNINVNCVSSKARMDAERLHVDCEFSFNILLDEYNDLYYLDEISFGAFRNKSKGEMILCYPEKNASLWDVAKKYGETVKKLKNQNALSENEEIINKKFLII